MVLSACSSYFEHLFMAYSENNQIVILKAGISVITLHDFEQNN
jgi:hypothetical protein